MWAAILASLFGIGLLWFTVAHLAHRHRAYVHLWVYPWLAFQIVLMAAFPVGGVLLLRRLRAGRIVLLVASGVTALVLALPVVLYHRFSGFLLGAGIVLVIAGLSGSRSTRRWLDGERA